jgi:sterol desaturase/sphingolipid hydroxylase (fatty acid hydroxylase superfamily)
VTATAGVVVRWIETPIVRALTARVAARRTGLLPRLGLPRWLETTAAVLLLDYTLYIWHFATHRSALLWRFHSVHHVDRELDVTTATRFHFGEILLSVCFRAAQIVLIGASPRAVSLWQTLLVPSILFHHSNVRLPRRLESILGKVIVTPHMHTIHHSARAEHLASNWSSGLVLWDWLHGTLNLAVDEDTIRIGVPGDDERSFAKLLAKPFRRF